jgi:hypothetical protein
VSPTIGKCPRLRSLTSLIYQEELVHEYGEFFEGKSKDELDALARSFHFGKSYSSFILAPPLTFVIPENCVRRDELNEILRADVD